ncbi:efflux RND transporter periplasmic adaptor subunit [Marinomonas pollencensis]|uniref:Multidrug efflux system membrane fusion protein n=1 Tax=Marinomonas pollencensis TaxID=491954 RepID=A0A3E0DKL0_9GAMM|nr:efflux RND transporter periplasmic adaptor subunit [Marinomonas pollencensis]REG83306.1 multidrug efflux system membrane fusion protein [Marinomonas pollencensis]
MELKSKIGPLVAIIITVAAVLWIYAGGHGITASQHDSPTNTNESNSNNAEHTSLSNQKHSVQVTNIQAQSINLYLALSGQTLADKILTLTNSYPGEVVKLYSTKGDFLEQGAPILQIDTRVLKTQIRETSALIKQRNIELNGLNKLKDINLTSHVRLAEAETNLASALTSAKSLAIDLENATVTAPFSGVLNTLDIEKGQMLSDDSAIGTLVSLNPLRIQVTIPQNKIHHIHLGTQGKVHLATGLETTGKVSYISRQANTESRSINVELLIDNPNHSIAAGLTADVTFALSQQKAQALSPALLTLDDDGNTAVKTVDSQSKVVSYPVNIVKSERDKVWVSGLPSEVNLITVGQGFVNDGDIVDIHH